MNALLKWMAANGYNQRLLAEDLGITASAVAQWKMAMEIPIARVAAVSRLTGLPLEVLRPDHFGYRSKSHDRTVRRPRRPAAA
jgi:hypothetical protein